MPSLKRLPRAALRHLPLVAVIFGAAGLAAGYALQATHWSVMTDELQTSKLAQSIADTFSPAPRIHGAYYGNLGQLYPLLLSPFFGLLSVPAAVDAAHALNALLLASVAWPTYLLARDVTGSRAGGVFAGALAAFVPWLVLSSTLLTENAAYPASAWALLLAHRTLRRPSVGRDAAAIGGLLLAFLARTQLVVLAVGLLIALLVQEAAYAVATSERGRRVAAILPALRQTARSHPLLLAGFAAAAGISAALASAGELDRLFGNYAGVVRGDVFPPGIWHAAAVHLDHVVVGLGVAPALLACAWSLATVVRPGRRDAHAFAVLLLVVVPVLTFEVASFDLRYTPGAFAQDRYLVYLAAPLAVGAAACLVERTHRGLRAALVVAAGVGFSFLAAVASFAGATAIYWAAPAAAFHRAIGGAGGWIGLSAESLVRWGALALAAALAALLLRVPARISLLAIGCCVAALGAFEAVYVFDRFGIPTIKRPALIPSVPRDWIDASLPGSPLVALVPNPYLGPVFWWEAEFWNGSVDRVLQVGGGPTFTPFPSDALSVDFDDGSVRGPEPTDLLVLASAETRLHLAGTTTLAAAPPLALVEVTRPYRADWATRGAYPDGWTRPGDPVELRFYPAGRPGGRDVTVTLADPAEAARALGFALRSGGALRRGVVAAGDVRRVTLPVCVPAVGFGRATLVARGGATIPDGRFVGLHLAGVEARPTDRRCR